MSETLQVFILAVVVVVHIRESNGKVEPLNYIPQQLQNYLDTCHRTGDLSKQYGEVIFWTACNQYASRFVQDRPSMSQDQMRYFSQNLHEALSPLYLPESARTKRQARLAVRVRREIRALNIGERRRFFRALNALKRDRNLPPNVYDFLAAFHSGVNVDRAHFGPAFGAWHRLYLWILEYFLRLKDPRVSLPYWASVMDNDMDFPTDTILFTPAFLGSGQGEVTDGPFRMWSQINPTVRIVRNVQGNQLYSHDDIERIVSLRNARDIFFPTAEPENNFELLHGPTHMFVGGTLNDLHTAAYDPAFFLHHCFVDMIWERFKYNQRNNSIDPESDYPYEENGMFNPLHRPNATAGFENLGSASEWTLSAGNLNAFSYYVVYEEVPSCLSRCANSPFCRCDRRLNRCVSRSRSEMRGSGLLNDVFANDRPRFGGKRKKRQVMAPEGADVSQGTCPRRNFLNDVDIRQIGYAPMTPAIHQRSWAFVPFKVVSKRPTEYKKFSKYSLVSTGTSNIHLGLKNAFMSQAIQKKYAKCDKIQDAVGKIKVVAYGLNDKSYSEEYVIVDNRLGVAESIGYLPVKRPTPGSPTDVILAAFDSCGRVCRPYCKQSMSRSFNSQFTGAVRVTAEQPLQYASSYSDATLHIWDIPDASACPTIDYNNIPVSFFCEYSDSWIWNSATGPGSMLPTVMPTRTVNPPVGIHLPTDPLDPLPTRPGPPMVIRPPGRRRGRNRGRGRGNWRSRSQNGRVGLDRHVSSRHQLYSRTRSPF